MKQFFLRNLRQISNFLFPSNCALCDCELLTSLEIKYGLCNNCKESIVLPQENKCNICGIPLISEIDTCLSCRNQSYRSFDRLWLLYPYNGKYRELLAKYKFQKRLPLANFFIEQIKPLLSEPELIDACIVPVPPRPGKKKEQGWDQVDYLVRKLNKKYIKCLKRRKSQVQKELNREERIKNLEGRIYSQGQVPKTALLIDDVLTTGSTIEVCASVLKKAGAEKVYGICLFYD